MSTEVNHDSGDTGDSGEHGGYQGGDNGQESGYGHDDSGFSNSGNDEDQNGYGHESASEDEGHQFSPMQEHMGFTTGFGPAVDLPRNAFGVPDYRGFSMPGGGEALKNKPDGVEPSAFERFSRHLEQRGQDISQAMAYNIRGNMTADEHTAYIKQGFAEGFSPAEFAKGIINEGKPSDADMWNAPAARKLGRILSSPGLDPEGLTDAGAVLGKLASGEALNDADKWNVTRPIGGAVATYTGGRVAKAGLGLLGATMLGRSVMGKLGMK